jgi:phage gp29-like protein
MLAQMGSAGWAALPKNTDIEFIMAPGNGGVGPAERLVDLADRICDIFILGQTLSTDVGKSGSRALGEVHAGVKQDVIEAVSDFSAGTLKQLVRAIVALNYDNTAELPEVTPDIKDSQDELKMAERDQILFAQMKLPVAKQYLYERHNVPAPQTADVLYTPPLVTAPVTTFDAPKP